MASREAILEIRGILGPTYSFESAEMVADLAIKGVTDALDTMNRIVGLQSPDLMIETAIIMNKLMQGAIEQDMKAFTQKLQERR